MNRTWSLRVPQAVELVLNTTIQEKKCGSCLARMQNNKSLKFLIGQIFTREEGTKEEIEG